MLLAEPLFVARNPINQVLIRNHYGALIVDGKHRSLRLESGEVIRLAARLPKQTPINRVLIVAEAKLAGSKSIDLTDARWAGDRAQHKPTDVTASLADAFDFLQAGTEARKKGLRPAQIGAVHAVLGYWTTKSPEPATVVMPTGTGKTDTMLALFAVE